MDHQGRVTVRPAEFTLVPFDAAHIAAAVEAAASRVGFPPDVAVELTVDEELFAPLVGSLSDVVDGRAVCWISGGNLEDTRRPRHFSEAQAAVDFALLLLRAGDRLEPGFAGAPPDAGLTLGQRAAWDAWATGRAERLGLAVRRQRTLYDFRLQHGFTDVADRVFERLWSADTLAWVDLVAACAETGAADRPPAKVPVDVLRRAGDD